MRKERSCSTEMLASCRRCRKCGKHGHISRVCKPKQRKIKICEKRVELSSYLENEENNKITIRVKAGQSLSVHMQVDGIRLPMEMNTGTAVSTVNMAEMF